MTPGAGSSRTSRAAPTRRCSARPRDRAATLLVRGARDTEDAAVVDRVLHLAETEGLETLAEVWSGCPPDTLAGSLWRLYVLRAWVYADPAAVAREYEAGSRARAQVARVVAGVADPPGPEELKAMVDEMLRGIVGRTSPTSCCVPRPSPGSWRSAGRRGTTRTAGCAAPATTTPSGCSACPSSWRRRARQEMVGELD